jgi:rhodanese-related sulfurtransferase
MVARTKPPPDEPPRKRRRHLWPTLALTGLTTLAGCCPTPSPPADSPDDIATSKPMMPCSALSTTTQTSAPLVFERSPGGTPEISPERVVEERCNLRIIDVRERHELVGDLGHIEGSHWLPLRELAREAEHWDRNEALVLVDRSGRRSGRAARYLDELGFAHVASMTGGMIAWERLGYPTSQLHDFVPSAPPRSPSPLSSGPLTAEDVEIHVGDPSQVRWTKAATLLLHGTESCVDGRDDHAVVGTPGGDAGELLAALATAESLGTSPLEDADVDRLFADYVAAFGHFYMHTDEHGLEGLAEALRHDPRFAEWHARLGDVHAVEAFVRQPPVSLQEPLIEHLTEPGSIGCGHLRLMRQHPDEYGVRPALLQGLFRAFFHRLWHGSEELEYVVLFGEHEEAAVLNVQLSSEVHPYTAIPMVSPKHLGREMFVNHPQVASFIRRQNAGFLLERGDWPRRTDLDPELFLERLEGLASRQLARTIHYLAADLPIFDVRFEGQRFSVDRQNPER